MSLDSRQLLTMGDLLWKQAEQNSEDFAIALSLAESYGSYSDTLIQDFAIAINEKLRRKLKEKQDEEFLVGFTVKDDASIRRDVLEKDIHYFGLDWEGDISVVITSWPASMQRCYWGLWVAEKVRDVVDVVRAQAELSTQFNGKKGGDTCVSWNWFGDSDAKNWKAPRAVERMTKAIRRQGAEGDTAFLDIFVDTLISVALIAEKNMKK